MAAPRHASWGRYPDWPQQGLVPWFEDQLPALGERHPGTWLPYGQGRSYGDSVHSASGTVLDLSALRRVRAFDPASGVIECEAGLTLQELIDLVLPSGWLPAVTPGTRFVTVGGAIANDVHGKNHHRCGSFGDHLLGFELLRSDGLRLHCSPTQHPDWFAATLGGLGLTGVITTARLQLRRVQGPWLHTESIRFGHLDEFFALSAASAADWEYTVAWIDCLAQGAQRGRGHFLRANHAGPLTTGRPPARHHRTVPVTPPLSLINRFTLPVFNHLYYHRQRRPVVASVQHILPYFYPLDGIGHWNRLYGPRGFQQYQCVLPPTQARDACDALLAAIAHSGEGSFLAVLKQFGPRPAPGWLSFARPGTTLALDFAQRGAATERLFARLDAIVHAAGGALYPAKDAHMGPALFQAAYPRWAELEQRRDPKILSRFWQRVTRAQP